MSRTNWKQVERDAAAHFGALRYPANMGGPLDFGRTGLFVGQVKNTKVFSLAALERLAISMEDIGRGHDKPGVVVIKRSAGAGRETPMLVLMTMRTWDDIYRLLPEPFKEQQT